MGGWRYKKGFNDQTSLRQARKIKEKPLEEIQGRKTKKNL